MKKQTQNPCPLFKELTVTVILLLCLVSANARVFTREFKKSATADVTAPTIVSLSPANEATNVSVDANLVVTFSEPIQVITGGVMEIKAVSGGITFASFTLPHASVSVSGTTLTINPTNNLTHSTNYYVDFTAAVEDLDGNDFAGPTVWFFETRANDYTAPTLSTLSPTHGATNFSVGGWAVATFSEYVTAVVDKTVSIRRKSDDALFETFTLPSSQVVVSASQVTIKPTLALENSTEYYILIEAGAFIDLSTNEFAGVSSNTTWPFKTNPALVSLSPANGASHAEPSGNLVATFSENVSLGSGTVFINNFSSGTTLESITLPDARVTVAGASLIIDPTATLPIGPFLYVAIQHGVLKDADGDDIGQIGGSSAWGFYAAEEPSVLPTVISLSPTNNTTGVGIGVNPMLTFSENVGTASGGALNLKRYNDDHVVMSVGVVNSSATSNTYSMGAVSGGLSYNTKYYITVSHNAFKNVDDNFFAGFIDKDTWSFTTEPDPNAETIAPTITSYFPTNGATEVDRATGMELQFSEHVSTVASKEINIYRYADDILVKKFILSAGDLSSSYNITNQIEPSLEGNTQYYVLVDSGAFKDSWENEFAGISDKDSWKFTAKPLDVTPPAVVSTTPSDGAVDVPVDISEIIVGFDEPFYEGTSSEITITGFGTLEVGAVANREGSNLYIYPPAALAAGTTITVTLAAGLFQDNDGNPTEEFSFSFTTATEPDTEAPIIVSLSPEDDATAVSLTTDLVITFNEPVIASAGSIVVKQLSDNSTRSTTSITNAIVSGNTVSVEGVSLQAGTEYYVDLSVELVRDAAGNYSAGQSGNPNWTFTTEAAPDTEAPFIVSLSPEDDATGVSLTTDLVITFNEPVIAFDGNIFVKRISNHSIISTTLITNAVVSDNTVTVEDVSLEEGVEYYVDLPMELVRDAAGNYFAGQSGNPNWTFTAYAPDVTAPQVVVFIPENSSPTVPINQRIFKAKFDEPFSRNDVALYLREFDTDRIVTGNNIFSLSTQSGDTLIVDLNSFDIFRGLTLASGTRYYFDIASHGIKDVANNTRGFAKGEWEFTTSGLPGTHGPLLEHTFPAADATNAAVDNWIYKAYFDRSIVRQAGLIYLKDYQTDVVVAQINVGALTISNDTLLINFNPSGTLDDAVLAFETKYYIDIPSGVLKDDFGYTNVAQGKDAWAFTTEAAVDTTAPYIVSVEPTDDATDVSINTTFTITFSEPVVPNEAGFPFVRLMIFPDQVEQVQLSNSSQVTIDGSVITISFSEPLQYATTYLLSTFNGMVKDAAGNVNTENPNFEFTTEPEPITDTTPPSIILFSPANNATGVALDATLSITFDEPVKLAPGGATKAFIIKTPENDVSELVLIENSNINGNTVSATFPQLAYNRTYYLILNTDVLADMSGNVFNGFTETDVWRFSTEAAPKQEQTISFDEIEAKTFGDAAFEVTANASSELEITLTSSDEMVATINGKLITIIGAGSTHITATQGGDEAYNAASPVVRELVVNKADQTILFESLPAVGVSASPFALSAQASSGLNVVFTSSNESVATISGNTVTVLAAGSTTISALQSGNANYNAAAPIERELTVNAETAAIALSGSLAFEEVLLNESVEKVLTITNNGNAALVITSITIPAGFATSVTNTTVNAGGNTSVTITFTPTEAKAYAGNVVVTSNAVSGSDEIAVSGEGVTITGLNEPGQFAGTLDVYPNPGNGLFIVAGQKSKTITITDFSGKKHSRVMTMPEEQKHQLDITDLPGGVYYLQIEEKGAVAVKRIIKLN